MKLTIEELLSRFLSNQLSGHTRRAYGCDMRGFLDAFSHRDIEEITTEDMAGYRDRLMERLQGV